MPRTYKRRKKRREKKERRKKGKKKKTKGGKQREGGVSIYGLYKEILQSLFIFLFFTVCLDVFIS